MSQLNIKQIREKLGISQAQLATTMSVNQTAVSQWERGTALPACDKLPALAAALNCSIDELFSDKEAG